MKFYVCKKQEAKDYVILTGIVTKKVNENYVEEVYKRFFKKEEYAKLNIKETFPLVIEFTNSLVQKNG